VEGAPHFAGDALADPLTGLCAAAAAMEALAAGQAGRIDAALAPTAAYFAAGLGA
jgi:crotonobetainyl-CoA:carnitine CoA-transferase CaiB-like acyl-CoA transferase